MRGGSWRQSSLTGIGVLFGVTLAGLLLLPFFALAISTPASDLLEGATHPLFASALLLSLRTTLTSLSITVVLGTPLAWWLASSSSKTARVIEVLVGLPIVIPPAVVGVALLQTFGREGLLGPALGSVGIALPFTEISVVLAQIVVSAPFFVKAGASAFREVRPDMLIVARTLGASPPVAFFGWHCLSHCPAFWLVPRLLGPVPWESSGLPFSLRATCRAERKPCPSPSSTHSNLTSA